MTDPADIEVTAADQRIAAELAEVCVRNDGGKVGELLAELLDASPVRAIAVTAVLARNLAGALVVNHGTNGALKVLESTRLDASFADDDAGDSGSARL